MDSERLKGKNLSLIGDKTLLEYSILYAQESKYVNTDDLFDCSKKNCSQVLSCDEAYYKLEQCDMTQLDRNKNGIPCESICK